MCRQLLQRWRLLAFSALLLFDIAKSCRGRFKVYWNIPSIICTTNFNISFSNVVDDFGFTQNTGDEFVGDRINILYNPGLFPKVDNGPNGPPFNTSVLQLTNGGIPQAGDLNLHFEALTEDINKGIPDVSNTGLGVIDMEQWGATWEQNFNSGEVYQVLSIERVQKQHPNLSYDEVLKLAVEEYNFHAKKFMSESLSLAKSLRSGMKWGYYQYPQCFNQPAETATEVVPCSESVQTVNNNMLWLWSLSSAVYPSLYLTMGNSTAEGRAAKIRGMVQEAIRVGEYANKTLPVYAYIWYRYMDNEQPYLSYDDIYNLMQICKEEGAAGVVVWGSWNDFKDLNMCQSFLEYLDSVLGPITRIMTQ